jgi:hypothetical protein
LAPAGAQVGIGKAIRRKDRRDGEKNGTKTAVAYGTINP